MLHSGQINTDIYFKIQKYICLAQCQDLESYPWKAYTYTGHKFVHPQSDAYYTDA